MCTTWLRLFLHEQNKNCDQSLNTFKPVKTTNSLCNILSYMASIKKITCPMCPLKQYLVIWYYFHSLFIKCHVHITCIKHQPISMWSFFLYLNKNIVIFCQLLLKISCILSNFIYDYIFTFNSIFLIVTISSFPHSRLIMWFFTRVAWRVPLLEQEMLTLL